MKLIPAIDVIGGQCVRLSQGDYAQQKTYASDPLAVALQLQSAGITHLHLVDLDGAKAGAVQNWDTLERICRETDLQVDFGGGLRTTAAVARAFELGVSQVTGGSIAVKQPATFLEWLREFGGERIILGVDAHRERIAVEGWQSVTELDLYDFVARFRDAGVQSIVCTDIARDGMLQGAAEDLYAALLVRFEGLQVIASGGVRDMNDLARLRDLGLHGAIFGKAYYEGNITLDDLRHWTKMNESC